MNPQLFNKLTSSLRQAKAIRAGTLRPARVTTLTLDQVAYRGLRAQDGEV